VTQVASAWPRYPGYAVDLMPLGGIGRARVDGVVVAKSDRCLLVRESDHRDQLYFPRQDVDASVLVDSGHHTICPFKGEASYAGVAVGGTLLDDVMWWYPEPMAEVAGLDGVGAVRRRRRSDGPLPDLGDGHGPGGFDGRRAGR
jgi:acyl-CoA thioesterase-2